MTHGLGGVRHCWLPEFAERFQRAGDGLPRQESNPTLRQADYYDAFNFAASLQSVDDTRIVYWGTSFSGGNFLYAAAVDKRIKAAIAQCPAVSGETRSLAFKDRISSILKERSRITAGLKPERIPLIAESLEGAESGNTTAMFHGVHAFETVRGSYNCGGLWENSVTVQIRLNMLEFEGKGMLHRISPTPLLMVVPGNDVLVTTASQLAAYENARKPKQLFYIDGAGHFDIYTGDWFEQNIKGQIEFVKEWLGSQDMTGAAILVRLPDLVM
ncbi:alpha/beta superfamily hydrolase [Aspergillus costaricaensis CBS 115574]|uniref:Alpha/beta superfamily hydrolase n=1 Tax=Aspergillus costaricaensis CBS 115574 TaxID=1448317 RepID=A0ACD1ILH2_9EURO|nr:alpha/beta superfamily hydrolase [Aspergillus costaricaensis CBS 115574]RAK90882.1 alpha/beta superfamily hydrolase [Aspergillus costaricaensis CBS 115574]